MARGQGFGPAARLPPGALQLFSASPRSDRDPGGHARGPSGDRAQNGPGPRPGSLRYKPVRRVAALPGVRLHREGGSNIRHATCNGLPPDTNSPAQKNIQGQARPVAPGPPSWGAAPRSVYRPIRIQNDTCANSDPPAISTNASNLLFMICFLPCSLTQLRRSTIMPIAREYRWPRTRALHTAESQLRQVAVRFRRVIGSFHEE